MDPIIRFYILRRFSYCGSAIEVGDAHVFCYPQGIEVDGPNGVTELVPLLAEKTRGAGSSKFRVRTFGRAAACSALGEDGRLAQFVDAVHRLRWPLDEAKLENGVERSPEPLRELRLIDD